MAHAKLRFVHSLITTGAGVHMYVCLVSYAPLCIVVLLLSLAQKKKAATTTTVCLVKESRQIHIVTSINE